MSDQYRMVSDGQRGIGKIALLFVIIALIGNVVAYAWLRPFGSTRELSDLAEARELIHNRYVDEADDQAMIDAAIRGMVDSLDDRNSTYLDADDLAEFESHVSGEFSGIGAEVDIYEDRVRIIAPLDGSPAYRSGVLPGDIILEIDGTDTEGLNIFEAVGMLKGEAGTDVELRVRHRDGTIQEITITRDTIVVDSVRGYRRNPAGSGYQYMLDDEAGIAYVRLTQFGLNSQTELEQRLAALDAQGMDALILDLRDNGGGLLDGAIAIADMFLTARQTIVSLRGRDGAESVSTSTNKTPLADLPLVILVNENSASASEILAGAIRDNDRGLIVGARTFGKGSVQQVFDIGDGDTAVKLTTAYWYLPSGRMIHRREDAEYWGVDPSPGCYVPMEIEEVLAMLMRGREADTLGLYDAVEGEPLTPAWISEVLLDEQLAAALTAVHAMLDGEGSPRVGIDIETALAEPTERETLEQFRDALLEQLEEVEGQLESLDAEDQEDADDVEEEDAGEQDTEIPAEREEPEPAEQP